MMNKIIEIYKKNLFSRCDDNGDIFYFSKKDFKELKSEEYIFDSSKGYKLKGNFYYYDNYKPNHIVIFEHGMGGGHLSYFRELEILARRGYKVLSYDHSGCMKSEGDSTGGFCQSLCDLNDCINSIKNNNTYRDYKLSVIGHSWGAFSTMNIPHFHNDVKHIIAMSGFISLDQMLKQMFGGLLKKCQAPVYQIEKESNPDIVNINAINSLRNYNGKALIIHSKDDKVVKSKFHFDKLKQALNEKNNIEFLLVNNKNHNPNYTEDAVIYKDKFFKIYKKHLKKGLLKTDYQKNKFKGSFNWFKMTQQDYNIWEEIFSVLENE